MARRRLGGLQRVCVVLVKPVMRLLTRRTWVGMENIPPEGPVIIVANHISHADPFVLAHYVHDARRWPVFLAKASVFTIPVVGSLLRKVHQVPVARGSVDAIKALDAAVSAVKAGHSVIVYPEGTTTKEPDLWPMKGKTGVARLWLATGAPVIPVCMWGAQRIFDPRTRKLRPVPGTPITVVAGPPVDLSAWVGANPTASTLQQITDQCMLAVRDMLAEVRQATPPPLWTPQRNRSGSEG